MNPNRMNRLKKGYFKPPHGHQSFNRIVSIGFPTYQLGRPNSKSNAYANGGYINENPNLSNGITMYTRRRPNENKQQQPMNAQSKQREEVQMNQRVDKSKEAENLPPYNKLLLQQEDLQRKNKPDTLAADLDNSEDKMQDISSSTSEPQNETNKIPGENSENIYTSVSQTNDYLTNETTVSNENADITKQIEVLSDRAFQGTKRDFDSIAHSIADNSSKNSAYDISNAIDSVYSISQAQRSTLTNRTSYIQNDILSVRSILENSSKNERKFSISWSPKWIYTLFALCLWTCIVLCIQAVEENETFMTCSLSEKIRLWVCYWILVSVTTWSAAYFEHIGYVEAAMTFIFNAVLLLLLHPAPLLCIIEKDTWKTFTILKAAIFLLFAVLLLAWWLFKKTLRKD